jgi:murein DD-endopeptidase MepM/ murein hydrolase activator NlpD
MRKRLWVYITLALAVQLVLPLPGSGSKLSGRIDRTRDRIDNKRQHEHVLSEQLTGYALRISGLQGEITGVQRRMTRVQVSLERKRAELDGIRDRLTRARARLVRLRAELGEAEAALGTRLVEIYKSDEPDVLTVILEADGFADLLERTEFLERVSEQDARIVTRVRDLKRQVTRQVNDLGVLEGRAEAARNAIVARRNDIMAARNRLVRRRDELASVRSARRAALGRIRHSRVRLEGNLAALEREQSRIMAQLQQSQGLGAASSSGPIRRGGRGLIWPVNGAVVSPFGMRWGRLHAGVDIAVPNGTAVRASASGRVAVAGGVGGYGNYICVQHGGSLSTCYAHNSSLGVSVGQSVRQGQVIASSGCTGHCFGPHVHFETRIGGRPVDPMGYL